MQNAAPRNMTSCNNRASITQEVLKTEIVEGPGSALLSSEKKQPVGQLVRNQNQFASTGNYKVGS